MTLEALIQCDADTLIKMSDAELLAHFEQYLNITRPERAVTVSTKPKTEQQIMNIKINEKYVKGVELAKKLGLDVQHFPMRLGGKR